MSDRFCKDCKWVRPAYTNETEIKWNALCGRKLDPVTGNPDERCSDERDGGFWHPHKCGNGGRFWEQSDADKV